jgi:hypothetical protein
MFIITRSTQSWYIPTIHLHVLVSAYCGHHQVYRAFTIILPSICYTSLHWPVSLHIGSALYRYVLYVMPLCYEMC